MEDINYQAPLPGLYIDRSPDVVRRYQTYFRIKDDFKPEHFMERIGHLSLAHLLDKDPIRSKYKNQKDGLLDELLDSSKRISVPSKDSRKMDYLKKLNL